MPGHATHYKGELDKSAWGLKSVAQVCNYKGTIWATWDSNAPPFLDYIGDMRHYLDAALDHRFAVNGDRVSQIELEQPQVVQSVEVVGMFVSEGDGMHQADAGAEQLSAQVGRRVDQQHPIGQTDGGCAA